MDKNKTKPLLDKIALTVRKVIREELEIFKEELLEEMGAPTTTRMKPPKNHGDEHVIEGKNTNWQEKYSKQFKEMESHMKMGDEGSVNESRKRVIPSEDMMTSDDSGRMVQVRDPEAYMKVMSKIEKDYTGLL